MSLNEAQRAAVETLTGPLLVLAGAGTGKTRVVTYRIARLIQSGIEPDRILAVTFTNKAAREMLQRVVELIPKRRDKKKPEISTFHSHCVRVLRRQIHLLGFPNQFAIYDQGDQESVARQILKDARISSGAISPADFLRQISTWKSAGIRPPQAQESAQFAKDYLCSLAYARYQARLKDLGAVDFDDILLLTEDVFERFPEVLQEEAGRFDRILVDEYQDTNMSQYRIISGLARFHRNLCVVGDDDQAIYGWRGAEVRHILNFKRDWSEARTIRLEENYRSTTQILTWANRLIDFNTIRHAKKLRSTSQGDSPHIMQCKDGEVEAKRVAASIKQRLEDSNRRFNDFAILFRTNEQPRAFEMELRALKIPYNVVGSQSFFDRKEVKDVVSYLKALVRPQNDVALLRIVNTPPRRIGSTTLVKIREFSIQNKRPVWDALRPHSEALNDVDPKAKEALENFYQLMTTQARRLRADFSAKSVEAFLKAVDYDAEIERLYPSEEEREERRKSVNEVVEAIDAYLRENPGATLSEFLDDAALGGPEFSSQQDKKKEANAVLLSTYHAAKGLEFKEVYMVGMEEGILPHQRSIEDPSEQGVEEERRLCYVGITRARFRLTLSLALTRMKRGKARPTAPSRFLYEAAGLSDNPKYLAIKSGKISAAKRNEKT